MISNVKIKLSILSYDHTPPHDLFSRAMMILLNMVSLLLGVTPAHKQMQIMGHKNITSTITYIVYIYSL